MRKSTVASLLKLTSRAFHLDAALWLVLGFLSATLAVDTGSRLRWVYTILMFINTAALVWFGVVILKARTRVFTLAMLYMALNVLLSIADQFGVIDALVLALSLCVLGLVILTRYRMFQAARTSPWV